MEPGTKRVATHPHSRYPNAVSRLLSARTHTLDTPRNSVYNSRNSHAKRQTHTFPETVTVSQPYIITDTRESQHYIKLKANIISN